jgi:hypothetical protein
LSFLGFKDLRFQAIEVIINQGFKVAKFRSFRVLRFLGIKVSRI